MITLKKFRNKKILIIGLARSGIAAIKSLHAAGSRILIWDDNEKIRDDIALQFNRDGIELQIAEIDEEVIKSLDIIMMSPGIPLYYPKVSNTYSLAIQHNIPLYCDIEFLYQQQSKASFIGVTGTNGKSTTTALINHILKSSKIVSDIGGNIGIPALELKAFDKKDQFYVLELSSYQLDLIDKAHFDIAVCLSITPDHIDRHGSLERYIEAKEKIFSRQKKGDISIISLDNSIGDILINQIKKQESTIIPISTEQKVENGISVINGILYDNLKSHKSYDVKDIPSLLGEHNGENIAAAFATATCCGIVPEDIISYIKTYKALPHRMDFFHQSGDLKFINDSKATNSDSSYWAIKSLDEIYWIVGGICKDIGIQVISPFFDKIEHAYLIGESADRFAQTLDKYGSSFTIAGSLENAISLIKSHNPKKGIVLLSPACSSFDQWKNFEERGDAFIRLVKENWPN